MKNLKTISMGLLLVMIVSILFSVPAFASQQVSVIVNNQKISFPDAQPFIDENSRTLVPVRFVSEALGADVTWNQETQAVGIQREDITIDLKINSHWINVNEEYYEMDTVPIIVDDRTFVPLRFVSEYLNCDVEWIQESYTVNITDLFIPYEKEDLIDGNDLDPTPVKEVVVYDDININIEEGDNYYYDETGYLTIEKYSGVTIKHLNYEEYKKIAKTGAPSTILTLDRNKDLQTQMKDLTDDFFFLMMSSFQGENSRYEVELFISRCWKNGVQNREFYLYHNSLTFEVEDGENNTLIFKFFDFVPLPPIN